MSKMEFKTTSRTAFATRDFVLYEVEARQRNFTFVAHTNEPEEVRVELFSAEGGACTESFEQAEEYLRQLQESLHKTLNIWAEAAIRRKDESEK